MSNKVLNATLSDITQAAALLRDGKLVGLPTETVYGLAANAMSDAAVASIFAAKGRPSFNPLIVHVLDINALQSLVQLTPLAEKLAKAFWPGPLTLVMKRTPECPLSLLVSAGLETVAVRSPVHPVAREILKACGLPLAAPSANKSGRISPTMAAHVLQELGEEIAAVVDGGACKVGVESTVVDASGEVPVILRHGSILKEDIEKIAGEVRCSVQGEGGIQSPGQMLSHYAPSIPIRLNVNDVREGEALLAFGTPLSHTGKTLNLSASGDVKEAAANLFAYMRLLDTQDHTAIAVMPIPEEGLGIAINDRLRRAAANTLSS